LMAKEEDRVYIRNINTIEKTDEYFENIIPLDKENSEILDGINIVNLIMQFEYVTRAFSNMHVIQGYTTIKEVKINMIDDSNK